MVLASIWDDEGNYLTKQSKGFKAMTDGCHCCAADLTSKEEIEKEMINSMCEILIASSYFGISLAGIRDKAYKLEKWKKFKGLK